MISEAPFTKAKISFGLSFSLKIVLIIFTDESKENSWTDSNCCFNSEILYPAFSANTIKATSVGLPNAIRICFDVSFLALIFTSSSETFDALFKTIDLINRSKYLSFSNAVFTPSITISPSALYPTPKTSYIFASYQNRLTVI